MKKTLATAVLACVMTFFGFAASLQAQSDYGKVGEPGKIQYSAQSLKILDNTKTTGMSLTANLVKVPSVEGKTFGYCIGDQFVSLEKAIEGVNTVELPYNQVLSFGYGTSAKDFEPRKVSFNVSSDPGYYAGYNNTPFYQLDFSEDPFDGYFEIIIGKPLPAPTVTLIVALAAGALFLVYKNRRQRSIHTEQA